MDIATLDFESFWDVDYSLSRMSPLEYVMDERFEVISVSTKLNRGNTKVYFGDEVEPALRSIDWTKTAALGHNMSGFDAYIMAYRYKIVPRLWLCTAAMARPRHAKTCGVSLAKLVEHYADQLRAKGIASIKNNAVLLNTKGRRLKDFAAGEVAQMRVYNGDDTNQCRGIFDILLPDFSSGELWQIDTQTRMRTEPQFELDVPLLEVAASIERDRKHKALLEVAKSLRSMLSNAPDLEWGNEKAVVEFVRGELASAAKFSALLVKLDQDVPMKVSPSDPDKMVPALAKTDEAFIALQEHDDPMVAAAARARLDVKSTLLETRIQKFLTAGRLAGGRLPAPLRYCGADTSGRDSGEEYNLQNQPRINPDKPKPSDALRRSQRAPKGMKVIVADQSGIELRVNHFLWKVESSMALYKASPDKADLYRQFAATSLYNIDPADISKQQRQIGKVAQLGLGFGAGALTFQRIAKIMGGVDMPLARPKANPEWFYPDSVVVRPECADDFAAFRQMLTDEWDGVMTATDVVEAWREAYAPITTGWKTCAQAIQWMADGKEYQVDPWGLMHTTRDAMVLPSGRLIRYPDLRMEDDGKWPDGRPRRSWFYAHGRHKARLTGPKQDENDVQALGRDSMCDAAVEYYRRTDLRPALRVHDELIYVVPERHAEVLLAELQAVMRTSPKWWPELVVWSEGDVADTYGDAK